MLMNFSVKKLMKHSKNFIYFILFNLKNHVKNIDRLNVTFSINTSNNRR